MIDFGLLIIYTDFMKPAPILRFGVVTYEFPDNGVHASKNALIRK